MVRQGRSVRAQVLVFCGALAYLGWGIDKVTLASGFVDPVGKVRPQDEALYSSISIGMAERGEWLTPRFLGRLAFVKPLGAYLPAALSVKAFGVSNWSLRLPSLICGAALLTLLWSWKGWGAMLLVAANPLFFTLARRNMTDVPLAFFVVLAIYLWKRSDQGAGVSLGVAVLIKSVAGLTPLLFMWRFRIAMIAAALIAPWHLYQLAVNGEWYWKEHILDEHLAWGLATPENTTAESHPIFYLTRAWAIDPLLLLLIPLAIFRSKERWWIFVSIAMLALFGYRNATYLLPIFVSCAALADAPVWLGTVALAARLALGVVSHAPPEPVPPLAALEQYRSLNRPNGLIVVGVEDEFVATTMGLPRVQYALPGDARTLVKTNIDFVGRGIIASTFTNAPAPKETVILTKDIFQFAPTRDVLTRAEHTGGRKPIVQSGGWAIVHGGDAN